MPNAVAGHRWRGGRYGLAPTLVRAETSRSAGPLLRMTT